MCLKRIFTQETEQKNDESYAKTNLLKKKLNEIFTPE